MDYVWICRPGKSAKYEKEFLETNRIYLAWEGYDYDLSELTIRDEIKKVIISERNVTNRTTISNWSGMIWSFVNEMKKDDLVLIPGLKSKKYTLARITGEYEYKSVEFSLFHSREIEIINTNIERNIFPLEAQYSLGAFWTIFKTNKANEIINSLTH